MIIHVISFCFIYLGVLINKLNIYLVLLLQLNKLSLNVVILLFVFYSTFMCIRRWSVTTLIVYSLVLGLNYLNFINSFIYGFFKIHILLFYVTIIIGKFSILNANYISLKLKYVNTICLIVISFFLGSLWSLYLFDWGYYWTNDSIEYVLLLFILSLIVSVHIWKKSNYLHNTHILLCIYMLFMLRLNIIHTRHNFFEQNTLVYTGIKVFFIFTLQHFLVTNISYKFFIKKFNTTFLALLFLVCLIMINYINFFFLKLLSYNIYSFVFLLTFLLGRWGSLKYILIHALSFMVYICFIVLIPCYIFLLKFKLTIDLIPNYDIYLNKQLIFIGINNLHHYLINLSFNTLFNKWKGNFGINTVVSIFNKKLVNFII